MQLHNLTKESKTRKKKRVGRGGLRGKTSGRGMKGQMSRAGRKVRPEVRDMIKKIPKRRGYRFKGIQDVAAVVNVSVLNRSFNDGERVNPDFLVEKKILKRIAVGKSGVKILGNGDISKKLTIEGCRVSASAKEKIEKAGGSVVA